MSELVELRKLQFSQQMISYDLAEIRTKLRNDNHNRGLIAARIRKLREFKENEERLALLKSEIMASPYSRLDVVALLERLSKVENAIVTQGYEGGLEALRRFIDWVVSDQRRIETLGVDS